MHETQRREVSDAKALKGLAHPLRQQMLARLQRNGPATSADLAAEFGADRGATSYHLRQLARFGFIQEDTARSTGRRKYWRAVPEDVRLPHHAANAEAEATAQEIGHQCWERAEHDLAAFLTTPDAFGEFGAAALHSLGGTTLTAEELARFTDEYIAFLTRWHREPDQGSPGSRHITVLFNAFPTPDDSDRQRLSPHGPASDADARQSQSP
ncbi:winged helix-turn-helix transcriptional regulator [Streptomyces sp. PSKA54]|uniref:Winged helix-turn-helix transcriptional regulator n=1 Tax=Streptomyces himalayensis subsp. aureolus TaxID=2758039 RepID=A0A7W2HE92_9ACTN|nr:helix-turn-helix domain-containing protein [Streptomyces himalayensis]MBA4860713.1 winged helix-turn-helix transcriptional regulator [Streptomyces himalayensis subsp. aureolus]